MAQPTATAANVRELAEALADMAADPGDRETRQRAADRALDVTRGLDRGDSASEATFAVRMVAADLMTFAGVEPDQAAEAAQEGTGELEVADPPPTPRAPFDARHRRQAR